LAGAGAAGTPNDVSLEGPDGVGLNTEDENEVVDEAREKEVEGAFEVVVVAVVVAVTP
jgi:hypothetical protein